MGNLTVFSFSDARGLRRRAWMWLTLTAALVGLRVCPLCHREIPPELESRHHLVPKLKGGKTQENNIAILHRPCHDKIHAVFTEAQLARSHATMDALREHPDIDKFAKWIAKRPIEFSDGTTSLRRRQQRRWKMSISEGLDAESDSVGPGIYGGRVVCDEQTGAVVIGKQFEEHNALPGPVYAGGGYTVLNAAIRVGDVDEVRLLQEQPVLCDEVSTGGATPLHVCGMSRPGQRCTALIAQARQTTARGGLDVDAIDTWGYTALQRMATNNLAQGAQALLEAGADHRRPSGLEGIGDSARALARRLRSYEVLKVFQQWELAAGEALPDGEPEL